MTEKLGTYDFAHAVQEAYAFFWSELCDWYLEIVKPRLYDGEEEVSATLLWALERVLALLHPVMPFVTEEIWSHHPARRGHLAIHPFPEADESLLDLEAEAEVQAGIELTRRLRAWRDLVEVPAATVLEASFEDGEPHEFVGRLARFSFLTTDDRRPVEGESPRPEAIPHGDHRRQRQAIAVVGSVQVLASADLNAGAVAERLEARREKLRSEVERAERKLANRGFVDKAPAEAVEEEREKLARYAAELRELEG